MAGALEPLGGRLDDAAEVRAHGKRPPGDVLIDGARGGLAGGHCVDEQPGAVREIAGDEHAGQFGGEQPLHST